MHKDTFNKDGNHLTSEFDEYMLKFTKKGDEMMLHLKDSKEEITQISFIVSGKGIIYDEKR